MGDHDGTIPAPGDTLGGKYEVARVIASGGMGVVIEARNRRTDQRVALKVLHPALRTKADVTARFEREGRTAGRLHSRHVARILDVDSLPDGSPFLVMELLIGRDLDTELGSRGPLPYGEAVDWVLEACAAMAEAHAAGIIHRDLKPSNLFLAEEAGGRVLKVLDFGISKISEEGDVRMTATHSVLGTPLYMSPEHVRSSKDVDARSDIWSLGVILFELVTGNPPFHGGAATAIIAAIVADPAPDVGALCPALPRALAAEIMRALAKDVEVRQQDVRELARGLEPFAGERGRSALALLAPRPSRDSITILPGTGLADARADAVTVEQVCSTADTALASGATELHAARTHDGTELGPGSPERPRDLRSAPRRLALATLAIAAVGAVAVGFVFARGAPTPAAAFGGSGEPASPSSAASAAQPAATALPSVPSPRVEPEGSVALAASAVEAPAASASTHRPRPAVPLAAAPQPSARPSATPVATSRPTAAPPPAPAGNPLHL